MIDDLPEGVDLDTEELRPLHSFYIHSEEMEGHMDSYANVNEKSLQIYDSSENLCLTYTGLNIRGCQDVDQGYLYAISDGIAMPYACKDEKE